MYLTQPDFSIEEFLKATGFITPPGTTLDYFIVPKDAFIAPQAESAFVAETPDDESITYRRTEPIMKQDMATDPIEYSFWEPGPLKRRQPSQSRLPPVTDPEQLECPLVKVLSESDRLPEDVRLQEAWQMFPKGTVFHFTKARLKEAAPDHLALQPITKRAQEMLGLSYEVPISHVTENVQDWLEDEGIRLTEGVDYVITSNAVKPWREAAFERNKAALREQGWDDAEDLPDNYQERHYEQS